MNRNQIEQAGPFQKAHLSLSSRRSSLQPVSKHWSSYKSLSELNQEAKLSKMPSLKTASSALALSQYRDKNYQICAYSSRKSLASLLDLFPVREERGFNNVEKFYFKTGRHSLSRDQFKTLFTQSLQSGPMLETITECKTYGNYAVKIHNKNQELSRLKLKRQQIQKFKITIQQSHQMDSVKASPQLTPLSQISTTQGETPLSPQIKHQGPHGHYFSIQSPRYLHNSLKSHQNSSKQSNFTEVCREYERKEKQKQDMLTQLPSQRNHITEEKKAMIEGKEIEGKPKHKHLFQRISNIKFEEDMNCETIRKKRSNTLVNPLRGKLDSVDSRLGISKHTLRGATALTQNQRFRNNHPEQSSLHRQTKENLKNFILKTVNEKEDQPRVSKFAQKSKTVQNIEMLPLRNRENPCSLSPRERVSDLQSLMVICKKCNINLKTLLTYVMSHKLSPQVRAATLLHKLKERAEQRMFSGNSIIEQLLKS